MFQSLLKMFQSLLKLFKPKETLSQSNGPETYEEAVQFVADRIDNNTVKAPCFHFSGGMAIRNSLGLWNKESKLYQHMLARFGLCHADDTGTIISNAAHALKNNAEYDPQVDIDRCKTHWRNMGFDPATMEELR